MKLYTRKTPVCPQCESAKNILNLHNVKYDVIVVGEDISREQLMEMYPSARSFPVVVDDAGNIGGYETIKKQYSMEKSYA